MIYYLYGNTIVVRQNGTINNYIAFTDNLGSILSVMDENGMKVLMPPIMHGAGRR